MYDLRRLKPIRYMYYMLIYLKYLAIGSRHSKIEIEKQEFRPKIRLCPNRGSTKGKYKGRR